MITKANSAELRKTRPVDAEYVGEFSELGEAVEIVEIVN